MNSKLCHLTDTAFLYGEVLSQKLSKKHQTWGLELRFRQFLKDRGCQGTQKSPRMGTFGCPMTD